MPFSVLPSSVLGPEVSGEEPHVYTQVLCCASVMPPPLSSYFTELFFPSLLVLLTLAEFLVLWKELGCSQIWGLKKGLCWVPSSVWTVGICVSSREPATMGEGCCFCLLRTGTQFYLWLWSMSVLTCSERLQTLSQPAPDLSSAAPQGKVFHICCWMLQTSFGSDSLFSPGCLQETKSTSAGVWRTLKHQTAVFLLPLKPLDYFICDICRQN